MGDVDDIAENLRGLVVSNLFEEPPPKEDCPICMLPMPFASGVCGVTTVYMPCCGKTLCDGCVVAAEDEIVEGRMKDLCPFCRVPIPRKNEDILRQFEKRMELNDAYAFYKLGCGYKFELWGAQDNERAFQLFERAVELGCTIAHHSIAYAYKNGQGVEEDFLKSIAHSEFAAVGGHEGARLNLGMVDKHIGRMDRAIKHFVVAARSGFDVALKEVGEGYKAGHITKDEYASTLRAYKDAADEMKSEQRTRAEINVVH